MTPEERAELDRLLDLAEKEKLLEQAPASDGLAAAAAHQEVLRERLRAAVAIQADAEAVRQKRVAIEASPATRELKWGDPDGDEMFD